MIDKIKNLAKKRIQTFVKGDKPEFYKGSTTYLEKLEEEIEEMLDEVKENNFVYLEDELGDVLWVYICLLESLQSEGKIRGVNEVFERAYQKFSERISPETGKNNGVWEEVKNVQKVNRKKEHMKNFGDNN